VPSVPNSGAPRQGLPRAGIPQASSEPLGAETPEALAAWAGVDLSACPSGVRVDGLAAVVSPPAACPGCVAEAGEPWPVGATTCHCARCLDRIRRVYRCVTWNADHAHRVAAGHASWDAFSARWRASGGLPPLSTGAVRRYVTVDMIRGPSAPCCPQRCGRRSTVPGARGCCSMWLPGSPTRPHPRRMGCGPRDRRGRRPMDAEARRPPGQPPRRRPPGLPKPHAPRLGQRLGPPTPPAAGASSLGPSGPTLPVWRRRPRDPRRPPPHAAWNGLVGPRRDQALERDALRRFLRAYPRAEADVVFEARGPDGRPATITRGRLSQLIDTRLHPRRRQVVRLGIEERWPRVRVRAHLKGISAKTYERDQQEALDALLAAIRA